MDYLLWVILNLVIWPYRAIRDLKKNSGVGVSKSEQNSIKFWRLIAFIGVGLVAILVLIFFLFEMLWQTAS